MKHLVNYRPQIRSGLALLAVAAVVTVFSIFTQRTSAFDQELSKLNKFVQTKANTASMQIFREGRDFIEAQNWQRAAEKFNEFIKGYPKDKDLDAALYWYAYALRKQDRKDDAANVLIKLINRFPGSTWRQEAQAMLVEIGRKDAVEQALERDDCEIKMLALQSLFQADEERAIGIATEALRTSPAKCEGFQAAVLSILGSHGGPKVTTILLDIARNNPDPKLRMTAIRRLGEQKSDQITDELIRIYDADKTKEIRSQVIRALAERDDPRARAKLFEIARGNDPVELRAYTVRQLGEKDDEQTVNQLVSFYDAEQNVQVRMALLRGFGDSKQKVAVRKLMTIAKADPSVELRKAAVRYLGDSKDPEALKFLEELLK